MNDSPVNLDHAQLLLYLYGELSAAQRREIETKLASDATLRQELEKLRQTEMAVNQGLSAADSREPLESRVRSSERQIGKILQQWQVDRVVAMQQTRAPRQKGHRIPYWLYPLSAVAMVMMTLGIWYLSMNRAPDGSVIDDSVANQNGPRGFDSFDSDEAPTTDFQLTATDSTGIDELESELSNYAMISGALR